MTETPLPPAQLTAETLSEALPYIQRYAGRTIVIKFGGHAMVDEALSDAFARDVVLLKHLGANPVVVHGGGPQIAKLLERLGIQSEFRDGLRVTDDATMEAVEMVLSGPINKSIVRAINAAGGKAVGLSGSDGDLMRVTKATRTKRDDSSEIEKVVDLGYVGEPEKIDISVLNALMDTGGRWRGWSPLKCERRYRCRGRRCGASGETPAASDRCCGRARQTKQPDARDPPRPSRRTHARWYNQWRHDSKA